MNEFEELFGFDDFSLINEISEPFQNEMYKEVDLSVCENLSSRGKDAQYIGLILQGMEMEKHLDKFLGSRISLETFLHLNQSDLINLEITDEQDIKIILDNLKNFSGSRKDYSVPLNIAEDLIIAKNVQNQMIRLEAYASYLVLKLSKEKFVDYDGENPCSPARCLNHFANSAISQCDIMAENIYGENNSDNLINKLLKAYSLDFSINLKKKLTKKQKSYALHLTAAAILGIVNIAITAYFIKKRFLRNLTM